MKRKHKHWFMPGTEGKLRGGNWVKICLLCDEIKILTVAEMKKVLLRKDKKEGL